MSFLKCSILWDMNGKGHMTNNQIINQFVSLAGPRQLPSLNGWHMAVNSLLLMWGSLREQDIKFPLTSSINQDCVKNLFSIIGAKGAQRTTLMLKSSEELYNKYVSSLKYNIIILLGPRRCPILLVKFFFFQRFCFEGFI